LFDLFQIVMNGLVPQVLHTFISTRVCLTMKQSCISGSFSHHYWRESHPMSHIETSLKMRKTSWQL